MQKSQKLLSKVFKIPKVLAICMNHWIQNKGREKLELHADFKISETVILIILTTITLACYFNSLLQFYYTIPSFVKAILEF